MHATYLRTAYKALGEVYGNNFTTAPLSYRVQLCDEPICMADTRRRLSAIYELLRAAHKLLLNSESLMHIPPDVLTLLSALEYPAPNHARIVEQLARRDYERLNKILMALGGTWSRKERVHIFDSDACTRIDTAITTGSVVTVKDIGYFPTPSALAAQLVELADVRSGHVALEPSAGEGAIVQPLIAAGARVVAVERDAARRAKLKATCNVEILDLNDCLQIDERQRFDRVVMNPPFCRVGDGDHLDHVRKVAGLLKPGGVLVSVLPSSVLFRKDRRYAEFRNWTDSLNGVLTELPPKSFKKSGTDVNTVTLRLIAAAADKKRAA